MGALSLVSILIGLGTRPIAAKFGIDRYLRNQAKKLQAKRYLRLREAILKTGMMDPPLHFVFDMTDKCNLRCKMCYINFSAKSEGRELNTEEVKQITANLSPWMKTVTLVGAEVFVRRDLIEILKNFKEQGVIVNSIATNGTLFTEAHWEAFRKFDHIRNIGISLDGPEKVHDLIRGKPGLFKKSVSVIPRIVNELGIPVHIVCCVQKDNLPHLEDLVDFLSEVPVASLSFEFERSHTHQDLAESQQLMEDVPMKFSVVAGENSEPPYAFQELREAILRAKRRAIRKGVRLLNIPFSLEEDLEAYYYRHSFLNRGMNFCERLTSGRIDSHGNLIHCFNIKTSFGNLLFESFEEVWSGEKHRRFRQQLVKTNLLPICKSCAYAKLVSEYKDSKPA